MTPQSPTPKNQLALASSVLLFAAAIVGGGSVMAACAASTAEPKADAPRSDAAAPVEASVIDAGVVFDAAPLPALGGRSFVAHNVYLGDSDLDGGADPMAWQQFGTDIDGKDTTADSSDVCTRLASSPEVQIDGVGGVDNSFGKSVLPVFAGLGVSGFSTSLSESIAVGGPSLLVNLDGLTDDPQQTAGSLTGQLLSVVHPSRVPLWTTTDTWSVFTSGLVSGTIASGAKTRFTSAKIDSGLWSSGGVGDVSLTLAFGGASLDVLVHHATVSFRHASANHLASGIVSGVVKTSELLASVQIVLNEAGGCAYAAPVLLQVQQASDIMQHGTNEPGAPCDGISIGIGFDAEEIAPPTAVAADPVPGTGCP